MTIADVADVPGAGAGPDDVFRLAEAYRCAAERLLGPDGRADRQVRIPGRLCALHAIELYLQAFLRVHGLEAARIRSFLHDLRRHREEAVARGLVLRARTARHIDRVAREREYVAVRYRPEAAAVSEITRLIATLRELATCVKRALVAAATSADPPAPCLRPPCAVRQRSLSQ
jgi:hypothetical protein